MSFELKVTLTGDRYSIWIPKYNPILVDFFKNLQSSRYSPGNKTWTAKRNLPNALDLHSRGFFSDREILNLMFQKQPVLNEQVAESINLFGHQKDWLSWCGAYKKALLTAEPGLGKTLMSMLWWKTHDIDVGKILVVCPASLIQNWVQEIKKFTNLNTVPVVGTKTKKEESMQLAGLHIISYECLVKHSGKFKEKSCLIIDESHNIKTPGIIRSKAAFGFSQICTHVLLMTGTPISQGLEDFFSQLRCIDDRLLGTSFTAFKNRYCIQSQVRGAPLGVMDITGYKNIPEFNRIVGAHSRSYLKSECLDLPEKTFQTYYVELPAEQRKVYREIKQEKASFITEDNYVEAQNILTRVLRMAQITQGFIGGVTDPDPESEKTVVFFKENPKLSALEDIIETQPKTASIIIMCNFLIDIALIEKKLSSMKIKYVTIKGSVAPADRKQMMDFFQAGQVRILIGQIKTIGIGFTLTKAQTMIFYSNDYSYTNRVQAEDRIHRIGQNGTCLYIDIVAKNTIDEVVINALSHKKDLASLIEDIKNSEK